MEVQIKSLSKKSYSLKNAFLSNKPKFKSFSLKPLLKKLQFLIKNSYFTFGNVLLLQATGISMGINSAPL